MARYLVTGGGGFIGSHLAHRLVADGHEVRVLDNFSTGHRHNLEDIEHDVELVEGSFVDLDICRRAVDGADFVLHQGALPSVPKSIELPRETHDANVTGTLNLLVAARDAGVKRFVYAASSSAYGDTPTLPKVESMPASPKSPYAVQKYAGELYCRTFFDSYGLETVALRYFNIFGPRQDPNSPYSAVIPLFVRACREGRAPTINGDGTTSRDFTFVDNVVEANLRASTAPPACAGRVYNVACGERVDLTTLAETIRREVGSGEPPAYAPERAGDVKHSLADWSRAREDLGYAPVVPFAEGIRRTVAWYLGR